MGTTTHYHSHIYFNQESMEQAQTLAKRLEEKFAVDIGRFWEKPVGPHPRWSVQIAYEANKFGRVVPYLMKNRDGLTVFTHPLTGDDYTDHTDHALWMGELLELKLDIFEP